MKCHMSKVAATFVSEKAVIFMPTNCCHLSRVTTPSRGQWVDCFIQSDKYYKGTDDMISVGLGLGYK